MIFYFTGTGNSKYLAEKILAQTGDKLMNIAICVQDRNYSFRLEDGEQLGFVVPVYFYGMPIIVLEFLKKLNVPSDHYCYALLNCGSSTANAGNMFLHAYYVDALFGITTVQNYAPMFKMENEKDIDRHFKRVNIEMDGIIQHITEKDQGCFDKEKGIFPRLRTLVAYPIYRYGRKIGKFSVNDRCIGCGLCENICPRRAIQIKNEKPVWQSTQCELCQSGFEPLP